MLKDNFGSATKSEWTSPPGHEFAITPHDSNDLPYITRSLFIGTGGNITVINAVGEEITYTGVLSGFELFGRYVRVKSTGTTAANIVGRS